MEDSRQQELDLDLEVNRIQDGQKPVSSDSRLVVCEHVLVLLCERELSDSSPPSPSLLSALAMLKRAKGKWKRYRHSTGEEVPDDGTPL